MPRLKALVLLDPFGAPFDREGLAEVTMPVLLPRPDASALRAEGNALALAAALPHPLRQEVVPGSHFVFTDECPASRPTADAVLCRDPPGVVRSDVYARVTATIVMFLRANL
jgi:predicted dienelactone hydrolase